MEARFCMSNSKFYQVERVNPDMVDAEIRDLEAALRLVENGLRNAPEGNVTIDYRDGKHSYLSLVRGSWRKGTRSKQYISLKSSQAKDAITAKYYRLLKPILHKELVTLQAFRQTYNPLDKYSVLSRLPENIQNLTPALFVRSEDWQAAWARESFVSNPKEITEPTKYVTKNNEQVRSKAELIIANLLYDLGIAYRYEYIYRRGGWTTYPDFTILHPRTGERFYLEYFGMMNQESYRNRAFEKIAHYQATPDAARFIYIFESEASPMNTRAIENLLKAYFC